MISYDRKLFDEIINLKIKYGWYDYINDKIILPHMYEFTDEDYYIKYCRLLDPDEVRIKRIGTCWDLTLLSFKELSNFGYEASVIWFECKHKNDFIQTHTFTIYQKNKKWFKFELLMDPKGICGPYHDVQSIINEMTEYAHIKEAIILACHEINNDKFKKIYELKHIYPSDWIYLMKGEYIWSKILRGN